jgi:hypothetical protein
MCVLCGEDDEGRSGIKYAFGGERKVKEVKNEKPDFTGLAISSCMNSAFWFWRDMMSAGGLAKWGTLIQAAYRQSAKTCCDRRRLFPTHHINSNGVIA